MRIIVCLLALAGLLGCGKQDGTKTGTIVGLVTDVGGRGDKSFNDSALRGLENWAAGKKYSASGYQDLNDTEFQAGLPDDLRRLGVKIEKLNITPLVLQSKAEQDYEPNIGTLVEEGAGVVIGVGFMLKAAIQARAKQHARTKFILIDQEVDAPNVLCYTFREEEGSFLVGAIAGLVTKTNVVSFVGGMEIPLIKKFEAGYQAGVKTTNPKAEILIAYTGCFDKADAGSKVATDHISKNADVLYHASGSCGLGVIHTAEQKNRYAIGVDSDQYNESEKAVLTSMIKHVDLAVYKGVHQALTGKFLAGQVVMGLKDGGVGYAPIRLDIPDKKQVIEKVEALKKLIIEGTLKVPASADDLATFAPPN